MGRVILASICATYIADVSFFNIRFLSEQETDIELLSFHAERKEKEQEKFERKENVTVFFHIQLVVWCCNRMISEF